MIGEAGEAVELGRRPIFSSASISPDCCCECGEVDAGTSIVSGEGGLDADAWVRSAHNVKPQPCIYCPILFVLIAYMELEFSQHDYFEGGCVISKVFDKEAEWLVRLSWCQGRRGASWYTSLLCMGKLPMAVVTSKRPILVVRD